LGGLTGSADTTLAVRTDTEGTWKDLALSAPAIGLSGLGLGTLTFHAALGPDPAGARLEATLAGGAAEGSLQALLPLALGTQGNLELQDGPLNGALELARLDLGALTRRWPWLALSGDLALRGTLAGTVKNPDLKLEFQCPALGFRGEALGSLSGTLVRQGTQTTLTLALADDQGPWLTGTGALNLVLDYLSKKTLWLDAKELSLDLEATRLDRRRLRPFLQLPVGTEAALEARLVAQGSLDNLAFEGRLEGQLTVERQGTHPVAIHLKGGPRTQTLDLRFGEDLVVARVTTGIPLVALRRSKKPLEPSSLEGSLKVGLGLPLLAPFLPLAVGAPEGRLEADLTLGGTLGQPQLEGRAVVLASELGDGGAGPGDGGGAAFTLVPVKRRLRQVVLELQASGQRLELVKFQGQGDPGRLEANGSLELLASPPGPPPETGLWSAWQAKGELTGQVQGFPVLVEGLPVGLADAKVKVTLEASPGDTRVATEIREGWLKLTGEELPELRPVPSNPSVKVLGWLGDGGAAGLFTGTTGRFEFALAIPDGFRLKGGQADLTLAGTLKLTRRAELVAVEGGLDIKPGATFRLFDNDFEVKGGFLSLAEGNLRREAGGGGGGLLAEDPDAAPEADPTEPVIKLVARSLVIDTHVLVALVGPLRKPELVLVSLPHLPEYSILSLLIMGTPDAVDDSNGEVRKRAAELVERFHNPSLKKQLFDRIGVDNLGLGFGSNVSQPIVTVGKQVSRTLYVETVYHHNAPPDTNGREGHVQYRLDRSWTFETVFGDAAEGGFGVFWGASFGGPPPPPAPGEDWGLRRLAGRPDGDADGVADAFDLCRGQMEDLDQFEDSDGCPDPDNDGDGLGDGVDAAPLAAETWNGFEDQDGAPDLAPFAMQNLKTSTIPLPFRPNSVLVGREHRALLQSVAALLAALPPLRLKVLGHSDHLGSEAGKRKVSLQRAQSVARTLQALGVPGERLGPEGLGSSAPADASFSEESRSANRRVELQFQEETLAPGETPGAESRP
jgi:outer membrane protein OmpA-like peptidoglycan-associated protein